LDPGRVDLVADRGDDAVVDADRGRAAGLAFDDGSLRAHDHRLHRGKANRSRGKRLPVQDLESAILGGEIAPVYLLCGTDPLLYQRTVGALVARLVTPESRAFNHDAFEGKSASAAQILAAARTLPMMAKRRLVVVRDVEGLGADGMGALAGYLD